MESEMLLLLKKLAEPRSIIGSHAIAQAGRDMLRAGYYEQAAKIYDVAMDMGSRERGSKWQRNSDWKFERAMIALATEQDDEFKSLFPAKSAYQPMPAYDGVYYLIMKDLFRMLRS